MKKLLEFLKDDNGNLSSTRLIMILAALFFFADWGRSIYSGVPFRPSIELIYFLFGIFGLKGFQKIKEKLGENKTNDQ